MSILEKQCKNFFLNVNLFKKKKFLEDSPVSLGCQAKLAEQLLCVMKDNDCFLAEKSQFAGMLGVIATAVGDTLLAGGDLEIFNNSL